jgi:hypothetical protein
VDRLSRFAPEEIVGTGLLLIVLLFVAIRPAAVTQRFESSPFATPAPGGGPARQIVPQSRPIASPPALLLFQRELARP